MLNSLFCLTGNRFQIMGKSHINVLLDMNIKQKLSVASPPGRYRLFHLFPRVILVQPHPAAQHSEAPKIRKRPFL